MLLATGTRYLIRKGGLNQDGFSRKPQVQHQPPVLLLPTCARLNIWPEPEPSSNPRPLPLPPAPTSASEAPDSKASAKAQDMQGCYKNDSDERIIIVIAHAVPADMITLTSRTTATTRTITSITMGTKIGTILNTTTTTIISSIIRVLDLAIDCLSFPTNAREAKIDKPLGPNCGGFPRFSAVPRARAAGGSVTDLPTQPGRAEPPMNS